MAVENDPSLPSQKCKQCGAYAMRYRDPDGERRCLAHSTHPESVARLAAAAQHGRAARQPNRKPKGKDRPSAPPMPRLPAPTMKPLPPLEGEIVPPEGPPPRPPRTERADGPQEPEEEPIRLRSRDDVLSYLERIATGAARGDLKAGDVLAHSSLVKAAVSVLGLDAPPDPRRTITGFRLTVVGGHPRVSDG